MSKIKNILRRVNHRQLAVDKSFDEGRSAEFFVLGDDQLGLSIARRLHADGHAVHTINESHDSTDIPGSCANPANVQALKAAGVSAESTVIVATTEDSRNLLIAQLVRAHFDVSETLVLVNIPDRYDVVSEAGHEPICATTTLCDRVVEGLSNADSHPGPTV